jgi:hypothetical protein
MTSGISREYIFSKRVVISRMFRRLYGLYTSVTRLGLVNLKVTVDLSPDFYDCLR